MSIVTDSINLQNFTTMEKIGQGSFGKVFKIQNKVTKKIYAAKQLMRDFNSSQNFLQDLYKEIEILSNVSHPSILHFVGFSKFGLKGERKAVIVTKYAPNGSLDKILKLGQGSGIEYWNETKKLCNIFGIASSMLYLHSNDIIHRDLKPANILEDEHLFPLISDFGLSKIIQQNNIGTITTTVKGTPAYTAPEIWLKKQYSKAGDVYSFSLIVYAILTNEEPFAKMDYHIIYDNVAIKGVRPNLDSRIPEVYQKLIKDCWDADPNSRPTFEKIVEDLKNNPDFITPGVNESEYRKYIEIVEKNINPYGSEQLNDNDDDIMKENFDKIEVNKKLLGNDNTDVSFLASFYQEVNEENIKSLPQQTQQIINEISKQANATMSQVKITFDQVNTLYQNKSLNSPLFISILKYFESISIEIKWPSDNYMSIFSILSDIKKKNIERMDVIVNVSDAEEIQLEFINNEIISAINIFEPVKFIKKSAFRGCINLKKIIIPSPVPSIGKSTFRGCANLIEITIPSSVVLIDKDAFRGCHSLKHITIPDSVTTFGKSVFRGCFALEEIKLSKQLTAILKCTFRALPVLKEITIPPAVTLIGETSFEKCSILTEITIPPSVESIEKKAFRGCFLLEKITIDPYKTKNIVSNAFQECNNLKHLIISTEEESIHSFDAEPFKIISRITILPNPKSIEANSFGNFIHLKEISIPSTVEIIKKDAFANCVSLSQIEFDPYSTAIENEAFKDCTELNILIIRTNNNSISSFNISELPYVTKLNILPNPTIIADCAFQECTSIMEVIIPSTIISIGKKSFQGCTALMKLEIPLSVTSIGEEAFQGCSALDVLVIPSSASIGSGAFNGCLKVPDMEAPMTTRSLNDFDAFSVDGV